MMNFRERTILTILLTATAILSPCRALAQWASNGTGVCVQESLQYAVGVASDGNKGAFVVWYDCRNGGANADIYAQRLSASGNARWSANGKAVCNGSGFQSAPQIIADSMGGAYFSWADGSIDLYAQRADSAGNFRWPLPNGLTICALPTQQSEQWLAADNRKGAVIAWSDMRSGLPNDIYVQRFDTTGIKWTLDGVLICNATGYQHSPIVIGDGDGGAIACWQDHRTGSDVNATTDLYAQRVDSAGNVRWTSDGVAICTADSEQSNVAMASDGAKGAIIAWQDRRAGHFDIYAQRIDSTGAVKWAANGITAAPDTAERPWAVSDGRGGAIIVWYDLRHSYNLPDIYSQRLTAAGAAKWTAGGVAVCSGTLYATLSNATTPIIGDGNCGAIITWQDYRNGGLQSDIYAQRLDSMGARRWTANGVAVCTATGEQSFATLATNGDSGAIITWIDGRINPPPRWDVFAEGVDGTGNPLAVQFSQLSASVMAGPSVMIEWRTETECNSFQWLIERADLPEGPFELLGTKPAAGNSQEPVDYFFVDASVTAGYSYTYRLAEVDLDGSVRYYGPVTVGPIAEEGRMPVAARVAPNPFVDFTVMLGHEREPCLVYNVAGQLIQYCSGARIGAGLPVGMYFVIVAGQTKPVKLVKLK